MYTRHEGDNFLSFVVTIRVEEHCSSHPLDISPLRQIDTTVVTFVRLHVSVVKTTVKVLRAKLKELRN